MELRAPQNVFTLAQMLSPDLIMESMFCVRVTLKTWSVSKGPYAHCALRMKDEILTSECNALHTAAFTDAILYTLLDVYLN